MSLKGTEYETAQEANMRLGGTVVLYDKEPVYISEVRHEEDLPKGEIFRVLMYPMPFTGIGAPGERKFISSGKFDLAPFRMGFMNYQGNVYYLSRNTARQNRQGLGERSLSITNITDPTAARIATLRFQNVISDQGFVDMIKNVYPSIEDAVKAFAAADGPSGVAISREYALVKDLELEGLLFLYHKTKKVGFMVPNSKTFKLTKKFQFLKEELKERNIPVEF